MWGKPEHPEENHADTEKQNGPKIVVADNIGIS